MPEPTTSIQPGLATSVRWPVLAVTGEAAAAFLGRMLSNVLPESDEEAAGAFLLEATGRIVSGGVVVRRGSTTFEILCPGETWRERLHDGLDKYRLAEPVEITPSDRAGTLWLSPPERLLPTAPFAVVTEGEAYGVRIPWTGLPELFWVGPTPTDTNVVDPQAVDAERIAAGTPAFGTELDGRTIPLDAGMYDWLSHTKGCYVGQEVVERMWSRDRQARKLVAVVAETATAPPQGFPLTCTAESGKGKLQITSAAVHPEFGLIGLGYTSPNTPVGAQFSNEATGLWRIEERPLASGRMIQAS